MEDIWKDIEGYPNYKVSDHGRVQNVKFSRILKPRNTKGYYQIDLSINNVIKRFKVHRLVALAFIPNPMNYPIIMHIDDNGHNNIVSNLKWGTLSQNTKDMYDKGRRSHSLDKHPRFHKYKLNDEIRNEIRMLYSTGNYTHRELASRFNVKHTTIFRIVKKLI